MASNKLEFSFKVIIGVIVTSSLLSLWIISYLSPIITAKTELALIDAEIKGKKAERQELINEEKTKELEQNIKIMTTQLHTVLELNNKMQLELIANKGILKKEKEILLAARNALDTTQRLNNEEKSKILKLNTEIENIEKKEKDIKKDAMQLEEILTFNSLNGLWKSDGYIDGKRVYLEFLPKGKIKSFAGVDGEEFIFSNEKWFFEDNQVIIESIQNSKELRKIGKIINGKIVGTEKLTSGKEINWMLERTR